MLIVEDDRFNRRLYRDLLEAEGLEVWLANSANEAIRLAQQTPPNVILMDIELPGMDGLEATRYLKADPRTEHIPVVMISAHAMGPIEDLAREVGCHSFLRKPLSFPTFQRTIVDLAGA